MAVLFVAGDPPWPVASGNAQRMHHVISGLATVGDVDVVNFTDPWRTRLDSPPIPGVRRWIQLDRPSVRSLGRWVEALGPGGKPLAAAGRRVGPAAEFDLLDQRYDIVWVHRAETFSLLESRLPAGRRVVDLVDLEDHKLSARAKAVAPEIGARRIVDARAMARAIVARREVASWRRLQNQVSRHVDAVVVTSQLDADRLAGMAAAPVRVVLNGADDPGPPADRPPRESSRPATVVFFGLLTYPPNVDAAMFLAEQVAPVLREKVPNVRVRMVGRASDRVKALHSPPEIEVTGFVEDLDAELAAADLALVPIRYGGGTRIKILDAWAHGLPVVSTPAGAEGLDSRPGEDIMLGESPEALAEAATRVLTDVALANLLAQQGRLRFEESYRWSEVEVAVTSFAHSLVDGPPAGVTGR
jgi:glycosyltransferase involved in cell wall biosynthesis